MSGPAAAESLRQLRRLAPLFFEAARGRQGQGRCTQKGHTRHPGRLFAATGPDPVPCDFEQLLERQAKLRCAHIEQQVQGLE